MYRVVWEFKDGRHGGNGSPISERSARDAATMMNRQHPEIHHWIEPVVDEPEMPKAPAR
jgi:hypothetical protein